LGTTFDTRGKTMKKVLLATTALALSAGVAYAENSLTLSGSARIGVTYNGAVAGTAAVAGSISAAEATAITESVEALAEEFEIEEEEIGLFDDMFGEEDEDGSIAVSSDDMAMVLMARQQLAEQVAFMKAAVAAAQDGDEEAAAELAMAEGMLDLADQVIAAASGKAAVAKQKAKLALENRITIDIGGAIETTSGLTFGGKVRVRSDDGGATAVNGARVYMATNGVEVGVGNIYGAINSMPNFYHSEVGLTGNGSGDVGGLTDWAHDSYSSKGGANGIEVMYSTGGVSAHVSVTDEDLGSKTNRTAAYLAYTAGDWTVAVGGQNSAVAAEDFTVVTAAGTVGTINLGLSAMDADVGRQITLSGAATMGATNVQVFVSDSTAASATDTSYGVGIAYDLGGASLLAGVETSLTGQTYADMGVSFKF
jgi:outer membrane protein OmpU